MVSDRQCKGLGRMVLECPLVNMMNSPVSDMVKWLTLLAKCSFVITWKFLKSMKTTSLSE